ncbi:hypothetical protein [Robiginitalea sp. IMCC43444]|uniref:hypothetical protein n=1 Tax=Robiginitalea sp. IMCC43444 TaxID=3459121 RepID=UPI004041863E
MKNLCIPFLGLIVLFLGSCSEESAEEVTPDYFVTRDLSFLLGEEDGLTAKGWPVNGCKEFDVKAKVPFFGEVRFTVLNCCVNLVCNSPAVLEVIDYFIGGKNLQNIKEITIESSSFIKFNQYDIQINPGTYALDAKTKRLVDLQYRVYIRNNLKPSTK